MNDDAEEFIEQTIRTASPHALDRAEIPHGSQPLKPSEEDTEAALGAPTQWALHGAGYQATTHTVDRLPPGCYDIVSDQNGPFCEPTLPPSGLLLELPEMRSDHVLNLVETFWNSEADYKQGNEFVHGGASYKCGIMLFGPPGTGKSCTIKLVSKKLIARGGTVFFADQPPAIVSAFLGSFARVERNRKCVVILEDFDSLINRWGESGYLQMLDSAKSIDNIMYIATTNYPDRLDARIYNRPGRFSHVVKIGLPGAAGRKAFLEALLKNKRDVDKIVSLTNEFSIDHLSALVNAVYREKKDLEMEVARLRTLFKIPKNDPTGGVLGLGSVA